ncbi:MAG: enoyl-CoA hydratase/isomerase family protein [Leptospiraceae bacterium]|nr:enoyl-CoA hydratase/isomerase family protein [Leptospiraceae bacterium]
MNYKRTKEKLGNGIAEIISFQMNDQNSLTKQNMEELGDILDEIKADSSVKGVILCTENPKFFCNGLDGDTLLSTPKNELVNAVGGICILFGRMLRFNKPVVTEVSGHAMGGGAVITSASDYKFMLEAAGRIAFTEVMVGLPLPGMFVNRIQEVVKPEYHAEVCLEATAYKAKEAKTIGLIDETFPTKEEMRKASFKRLDSIFRHPMTAIQTTKEIMNRRTLVDYDYYLNQAAGWLLNPDIEYNLLEAMKAMKEKRRPVMR